MATRKSPPKPKVDEAAAWAAFVDRVAHKNRRETVLEWALNDADLHAHISRRLAERRAGETKLDARTTKKDVVAALRDYEASTPRVRDALRKLAASTEPTMSPVSSPSRPSSGAPEPPSSPSSRSPSRLVALSASPLARSSGGGAAAAAAAARTEEANPRATRPDEAAETKDRSRFAVPNAGFVEISRWDDLSVLLKRLRGDYAPDELAFSFDFDGTLNARLLTAQHKEKTLKHRQTEMGITNAHASEFLGHLNREGVPWFVNTAAENPSRPADEMKLESREHGRVLKRCSPFFDALPPRASYTDETSGAVTKRDGCVLSTGYDKDVTILQAVRLLKRPTKVVVHVDDGEINLVTVAQNRTLVDSYFLVLVHFPLVPGSAVGSEPSELATGEQASDWLVRNVPRLELYPSLTRPLPSSTAA